VITELRGEFLGALENSRLVGPNFYFPMFIPYPQTSVILSKFFYPPTDAQLNCLKNNIKIYIKIDIKTAPTCFGAITIIRERII
jgi:hypothetical protein